MRTAGELSGGAQRSVRPPRILVVEDERIVALDITNTLRRLGYHVAESVPSGEAAVEAARKTEPDLVLMDIRLAGHMDGVSAAETIVSEKDAPVIFLTAHSDNDTLRRVQASRPYGYLLKPFRAEDLRCAIEVSLHSHAADKRLREQERWLRTILNSIRDGVVASDASNRVRYVNPVAEAMTGYESHNALGRQVHEIVRLIDEASGALSTLSNGLATQKPLDLASKGGARLAVEPSSADVVDEHGARLGSVMVLRDVADRRAAMREIERINAGLETTIAIRTRELQTVNEELEAFSYSLAHDLRSPLRAIDGFVQTLLEDYGAMLDESPRDLLLRVRKTAQRALRLIVGLLSLAQLSQAQIKRESIDLSAMATDICEELVAAGRERAPQFFVQPGVSAMGDRTLLQVVLNNLLSNAWKFTSYNPRARVEFGRLDEGDRQIYFVRDNGVGFDAASAPDIFKTFQRYHGDRFPGDGIGLALVDRAVKRMQGRAWAVSSPDHGATFFFEVGVEQGEEITPPY